MLAVLVVAVAAAAVALVTGAAAWESWRLTNPSDYQHPLPSGFRYAETPLAEAGLAYEESEIRIKDGTWIRGWLVPAADSSKRLAVVFLHGRAGDRRNVLPLLSMLHQAGAAVAAYDLRENGLSDGSGAGTGLAMREAEDARKAVEALHRSGYERIVLMGCSLGASAGILASAENRHVAGVVSDSGLASVHGFVRDTALRRLAKLGLARPTIAEGFARLVMWITRLRLGLSSIEDPIAKISTRATDPHNPWQAGFGRSPPACGRPCGTRRQRGRDLARRGSGPLQQSCIRPGRLPRPPVELPRSHPEGPGQHTRVVGVAGVAGLCARGRRSGARRRASPTSAVSGVRVSVFKDLGSKFGTTFGVSPVGMRSRSGRRRPSR